MAEFNVERQRAKAVAGAQGSRVRFLEMPRLDHLFERTGAASNASTKPFTDLPHLTKDGAVMHRLGAMSKPTSLRE
ncbi:hypothetical protein OOT33_07255 [Sphingobium sp. DEHP117]|jgi:hypothetical protein|uniref:hypothetical protein n=1 Tax=Sphingobium sp. DEHP117 TaxID=2993436 RepID=UPI0027D7266E|nr:hypothetical protein [Sphingobium sp. DEHP117]MDQ4420228.1 hypothetical protein [Sphingobium sp. DEHP117]